jgi:hypothetical protein
MDSRSGFFCVIAGNRKTGEFFCKEAPDGFSVNDFTEEELTRLEDPDFINAGVLGWKDGQSRVVITPGCAGIVLAAMPVFIQKYVQKRMDDATQNVATSDDSAAWLEALYKLPDTREK